MRRPRRLTVWRGLRQPNFSVIFPRDDKRWERRVADAHRRRRIATDVGGGTGFDLACAEEGAMSVDWVHVVLGVAFFVVWLLVGEILVADS